MYSGQGILLGMGIYLLSKIIKTMLTAEFKKFSELKYKI